MVNGWMSLLAGALAISVQANAFAEEVERDVCSCKVVQVGAQSSLRGGVCQRTEAGKCLMQWGSTGKVLVGNGLLPIFCYCAMARYYLIYCAAFKFFQLCNHTLNITF